MKSGRIGFIIGIGLLPWGLPQVAPGQTVRARQWRRELQESILMAHARAILAYDHGPGQATVSANGRKNGPPQWVARWIREKWPCLKRESPDTTPGLSHTTHLRTERVQHMTNLPDSPSPASHQYWGQGGRAKHQHPSTNIQAPTSKHQHPSSNGRVPTAEFQRLSSKETSLDIVWHRVARPPGVSRPVALVSVHLMQRTGSTAAMQHLELSLAEASFGFLGRAGGGNTLLIKSGQALDFR